MVITNSHYNGVYPLEVIANGGLLGDVIFFAVSGFCLFSVKGSFPRWYGKRIYRIYPPVIVITTVYLVLGLYDINKYSFLEWFVYPTEYHFIASIIVLYILYYIVMKIPQLRNHIPFVMLGVFIIYLLIYFIFYDKTFYHIDIVDEFMVRFLFFESMLLGAWFRKEDGRFRNSNYKMLYFVGIVVSFVVYFISKTMFVKYESIAFWQFLNQIAIMIALFFVFAFFAAVDAKLEKLPIPIKKAITFISDLTLEIYIVQFPLIGLLKDIRPFPLNWFALTVAIILSAWLVHMVCKLFYRACDSLMGLYKRLRMMDE